MCSDNICFNDHSVIYVILHIEYVLPISKVRVSISSYKSTAAVVNNGAAVWYGAVLLVVTIFL